MPLSFQGILLRKWSAGHLCNFKISKNEHLKIYTDVEKIRAEVENSKKMFKKYNWPSIDVTRRSVEETAASILKIYEIKKNK